MVANLQIFFGSVPLVLNSSNATNLYRAIQKNPGFEQTEQKTQPTSAGSVTTFGSSSRAMLSSQESQPILLLAKSSAEESKEDVAGTIDVAAVA
jgi:hypothetical protein